MEYRCLWRGVFNAPGLVFELLGCQTSTPMSYIKENIYSYTRHIRRAPGSGFSAICRQTRATLLDIHSIHRWFPVIEILYAIEVVHPISGWPGRTALTLAPKIPVTSQRLVPGPEHLHI